MGCGTISTPHNDKMEARRLLEDYFSDVKLSIFAANRALYDKYGGLVPLFECAKLTKQPETILRSCLKDSKSLELGEGFVSRKVAPEEPDFESVSLVFGPFPKFISPQFIKHFALKTGQACPMLVNSFMVGAEYKASFLVFRGAADKALFAR